MFNPLLRFVSVLYKGGMWVDRHRREGAKLSKPVISVGNIAMGGRSKSPFVVELCDGLKERGYEPVVLTRGYGRSQSKPMWLIPERVVLHDFEKAKDPLAEYAGDEALEIFLRADVPVLVSTDRAKQAKQFLKKAPPLRWVFVLDDGFQHWSLERDFDLVLLTEEDLADQVIPTGRLREGVESLDRADLVLVRDRDYRKSTKLKEHPPHGLSLGVLTTRAPGQRDYFEFFQEQFENVKFVELADHARAPKIVAAIQRNGARHWVLGLKEASKIFSWAELKHFYQIGHFKREKGALAGIDFYFADYDLQIKDQPALWNKLIEKIRVSELIQ